MDNQCYSKHRWMWKTQQQSKQNHNEIFNILKIHYNKITSSYIERRLDNRYKLLHKTETY